MRVRVALAVAALAAFAGPVAALPAGHARPEGTRGMGTSSLASEVLAQLNAVRRARGLTVLRVAPALRAAASAHSAEMAKEGYFDHASADGSPFWKRLERYYPKGNAKLWAVAENLLWSSPGVDASQAVAMWMQSPDHRKNMLDPRWREIGISTLHVTAAPGVYDGLEVTLVTADFGVRR